MGGDDDFDEDLRPSPPPPDPSEPEPAPPSFVPPSPEEVKRRAALLQLPSVKKAMEKPLARCGKGARPDVEQQTWHDCLSANSFADDEAGAAVQASRAVDAARKRYFYAQKKTTIDGAAVARAIGASEPIPERLYEAGRVAEEIAANDTTAARTLNVLKMQHLDGAPLGVATAYFGTNVEAHQKAKRHFTRRVRAALGLLIVVLGVALLGREQLEIMSLRRDLETAKLTITTQKNPPPSAEAAETLDRAFQSCANRSWSRCLDRLDEAVKIDPSVDRRPEVWVARQAAIMGMAADAKPAPTPAPPPPDDGKKAPKGAAPQ